MDTHWTFHVHFVLLTKTSRNVSPTVWLFLHSPSQGVGVRGGILDGSPGVVGVQVTVYEPTVGHLHNRCIFFLEGSWKGPRGVAPGWNWRLQSPTDQSVVQRQKGEPGTEGVVTGINMCRIKDSI